MEGNEDPFKNRRNEGAGRENKDRKAEGFGGSARLKTEGRYKNHRHERRESLWTQREKEEIQKELHRSKSKRRAS
jgi:hypothetical protein